jgi:hypothetical protein
LARHIYLWSRGEHSTAAAIVYTVGLVLAGMADNVLKPLLLGRGVEAPMPVMLLGAPGGMATAGILGMFVGATLLTLGYQIFMGWVAANPAARPAQAESDVRAARCMAGPRCGATRVAPWMHPWCASLRDCMELSCLSSHGDKRSYTYDTARHIFLRGTITPLATRSRFVRRQWVACGHFCYDRSQRSVPSHRAWKGCDQEGGSKT